MFGLGRSSVTQKAIFSDTDIRELIKFCPPPDSALRASASRHRLLRTDAVRTRLDHIIKEDIQPIAIEALPKRLSIHEDGIRAADVDISGLVTNLDKTLLLPRTLQHNIGREVADRINDSFVSLRLEASRRDIDADQLLALIRAHAGPGSEITVTLVNGSQYVSRVTLIEATHLQLVETLWRSVRDACIAELQVEFPALPIDILRHLALEIVEADGIDGTIDSDTSRVSFTPSSAAKTQHLDREKQLQHRVDATLAQIRDRGWAEIVDSSEASRDDIIGGILTHADMQGSGPVAVTSRSSDSTMIVTPALLLTRQEALCRLAVGQAKTAWTNRQTDKDLGSDFDVVAEDPDYTAVDNHILLSTDHHAQILDEWTTTISALRSQAEVDLASLISHELLPPITLYTNGAKLLDTKDDSLRQRNKDHVTTHLKTEILTPLMTRIRTEKIFPSRAAKQEFEKFNTAVADAKEPEGILTAVKRFQRKTKPSFTASRANSNSNISPEPVKRAKSPESESETSSPGPESRRSERDEPGLAAIKTRIMAEKLAAMGRMRRASDLLQHATWILLACLPVHAECLFVSAGKDASRMIKVYAALVKDLGDGHEREQDWARRLELLRVKVKKADDEAGAKTELHALASEALETRQGHFSR